MLLEMANITQKLKKKKKALDFHKIWKLVPDSSIWFLKTVH